jgi:probable rRNA maturation factor
LKIYFFSEYVKISFLKNNFIIKRFERIAFFEKKIVGVINFIFINDKDIKLMNSKYLKHNYPTDTISFNYSIGNLISGDIYIGIDSVLYNSFKYKCSIKKELLRVMIHSFLHLVGLNDKRCVDKEKMHNLEEFYLKLF